MAERLYGREALLGRGGLVPRMVGLEPDGDRRIGFEFPQRGPVVQLTGARGTGKTALLKHLEQRYHQRIPVVYVDLAAPGPGFSDGSGTDEAGTASPVTDLLYLLSYRLGLKFTRFGKPLHFPRLLLGLLAVTDTQAVENTPGPSGLAPLKERVRQLSQQTGEKEQKRRELAKKWVVGVSQIITTATGVPAPVDGAIQATEEVLTDQFLAALTNRDALKWWQQQAVAGGDGVEQLAALAVDFRHRDSRRRQAERHLVTALLADVAAHYSWLRDKDLKPRPLALLDNAHTQLGQDFLELLLQAQHDSARTRLAVVATALGDQAPSGPPQWREPEASTPAAWLLRYGIPELTLQDVQGMLAGTNPPDYVAELVMRLSAGRAGVASALCRAVVAREYRGGSWSLDELLDLPGADPHSTVAEELLRGLLPDVRNRLRLIHYAPALDDDAVRALSRTFPSDDPSSTRSQDAKDHLAETCWPHHPWPGTDGPFAGNHTLRTLLLHRLAALPGDSRQDIQRQLRARYEPQDARRLHHCLALGETDGVVRALHELFGTLDAESWLTTVNLVCAAPRPPKGLAPPPADTVPCPGCRETVDPVHQAIGRLVAGLWRQSAPLAAPDQDTITEIEFALRTLTQFSTGAREAVLHQAYRSWPGRLRSWQQAPDLPIHGGTAR